MTSAKPLPLIGIRYCDECLAHLSDEDKYVSLGIGTLDNMNLRKKFGWDRVDIARFL